MAIWQNPGNILSDSVMPSSKGKPNAYPSGRCPFWGQDHSTSVICIQHMHTHTL